jgi:CSLREA domain-containing protein
MPHKNNARARISVTLALLVVATLPVLPPRLAGPLGLAARAATTFTVNSTGDGGDSNTADGVCNDGTGACTLRAAIQQASAAGGDTINFSLPPGSVITLTGTELTIDKSLTIDGPGAGLLSVSGNNASRVFLVNAGTSVISGLTVTGGSATSGAGISNVNPASLTLNHCHIFDNTATASGGGGIASGTQLNINHSTISHNESPGQGGGIINSSIAVITNSTFSNNTAASGGGIANVGPLTLNSVTIASNHATNFGGGIVTPGIGQSNFANTLIADNTATNSSPDCNGANIISQDYNLIENPSGCSLSGATTHNITGVDPLLGPLQNNGGPTPTRALLAGSPAIDQGNTALTTDQRDFPRPVDLPAPNAAGGDASDIGAFEAQPPPPLLLSEFRLRGPSGANDEFVEVYNNSDSDVAVTAFDGSAGFAVAASDGVARCTIPNGTVLPARGHYLCVNSVAYSLASYPAGNATTATGDATYTTDIPDNAGLALFATATAANFTPANRLDAVGSTSEANTLYKEGTGYPALTPFSIDYAFVRDYCGKQGSITTFGPCPTNGALVDTNNNAADFYFVDTNRTSAGAGQRLGAPGPQNSSSPVQNNAAVAGTLLDPCVSGASPPNRVRDFTSDPANNSTFGTIELRRTYTNNTGAPVTRLRFRVADITTFPAPSGIADLRPRTSTAVVVTVDRAPCGSGTSNVTVQGTTLEQPPSQPVGGGFNSSMSAGTITLATPLANGASVDVRFLFGIEQTGSFKVYLDAETSAGALPPQP